MVGQLGGDRGQVRQLLKLALPVMLSRSGLLLLVTVDLAMTGQAGARELAFMSLALAPHVVCSVVGVGMMTGTSILIAQAAGAGRQLDCGAIWRVAMLQGAALGCGLALLSPLAGPGFLLAGQDPALAAGAAAVFAISAWGLPATYMFVATAMFLEAADRPRIAVAVMLAANLLNAGLNGLLIPGGFGLPAMGAEGAALATTMVRWICLALLVACLLARLDRARWGLTAWRLPGGGLGRRFRRLGYPIALSYGLESAAFATMALIAGLAGALHVAAYQITMNLVTLVYMLPLGIATATCIAVGRAVGRQDAAGLRQAARTGVAFAALVLATLAALTAAMPTRIAMLYSSDPAVLEIASRTFAIAALALLFDGLKEVLAGALRGTGDVWPITLVNLLAFWLVMVPLGYLLSVVHGGGAPALLLAVAAAAGLATAGLLLRCRRLASRLERFPIGRHRPAPPPGHPIGYCRGWPGGGAGRRRDSA